MKKNRRGLATFCCEVTPPLGEPIYSSYQGLKEVEYPLLAKGIVIEDGGERYVLCALDWCELRNGIHDLFREKLAKAAGTRPSQVAVQAVHQHTAPIVDAEAFLMLDSATAPPAHPKAFHYVEIADRVAFSLEASLSAMIPYDRVGIGQAKVDRVASNRRVPVGEGKVGFRGSSCTDPSFREKPEGLIDPLIRTLTFASGEIPLVRIHYYATHPQSYYGDPRASYDFSGLAREELQTKERIFQIYCTGCAGDIAAGKYNDGSHPMRDELRARLLAGMEASIASTTMSPASDIRWTTASLSLTPRNDSGFTEQESRSVLSDPNRDVHARIDAAMKLAFRQRLGKPIEASALHMEGLHVLHLPGEPAVAFQLFAQELRPQEWVAVAGCGDAGPGYICLESFFPEGGYEPTASLVIPESEAPFRDAIRRLLSA